MFLKTLLFMSEPLVQVPQSTISEALGVAHNGVIHQLHQKPKLMGNDDSSSFVGRQWRTVASNGMNENVYQLIALDRVLT